MDDTSTIDPVENFYKLLAATPRNWRLYDDGAIRLMAGDVSHCPISAVAPEAAPWGAIEYGKAARAIGMPENEVTEIVDAADDIRVDGAGNARRRAHRKRLLAACGLAKTAQNS